MGTLNVYKNLSGVGFLLDIQADILSSLNTRVVVPLMPLELAPAPADILNPIFEIERKQVVMLTQYLVALPSSELKEAILNLSNKEKKVTQALAMLHQGL